MRKLLKAHCGQCGREFDAPFGTEYCDDCDPYGDPDGVAPASRHRDPRLTTQPLTSLRAEPEALWRFNGRKLLIPIVVAITVLISQLVTEVSAQSPAVIIPTAALTEAATATPVPERCLNPETSSVDCFPEATPAPDTCWDCSDSTMTPERGQQAMCSAAMLKANPQMLDECFPDTWEWTCNPDGTCEMVRIDLPPPSSAPPATPEAAATVVAP